MKAVVSFRAEYTAALALVATAFDAYTRDGLPRPVLVGGAAVEYYTGGGVVSGDIDIVEADQARLEGELVRVGFVREHRPGHVLRGLYHPKLQIGVEIVSGALFDGRTDRSRLGLVPIGEGGVPLPPVEDMIADRLGQYEASLRRDGEMLEQARLMFALADEIDDDYLRRRVAQESGDESLVSLLEPFDRETPPQP